MPRKRFEAFVVAATALAIVASACGDSSTSPSDLSAASPATRELERFLVRANEAPGFAPSGKPKAWLSLRAFVDGEEGTKADEQRLRDHGFEVIVFQPLKGPSDAAGVANVRLFATEDGATRELEYLVSKIDKDVEHPLIERFDVPGVPTATGWTVAKQAGGFAGPENRVAVANVLWSQGRCVMYLGSEPKPGSEPSFVDQLRAGVKAIYERTEGRCP